MRHKILENISNIMSKTDGKHFQDISFSRKDRVLPLATVNSSVKVEDTVVAVDQKLYFGK